MMPTQVNMLVPRHPRPMPQAVLSPTRIHSLVRPAAPTVCRRTTRWRGSCGRPDPATGVACGGIRPACPALWDKLPCRLSSWPVIHTLFRFWLKAMARGQIFRVQFAEKALSPTQLAAPSRIRTHFPVRLAAPIPCHRTTRCPLLCASHDKREDVVRRQR